MEVGKKIDIGISENNRGKVAKILESLLANEYALYVETKGGHWNVTGCHFNEVHKFLEDQYEEIDEIIDDVAERIRTLGVGVAATLKHFSETTSIKEKSNEGWSFEDIISKLLTDHEMVIKSLRDDLVTCYDTYKDAGTSNFLTDLLEKHEKMAWMLRSSLEEDEHHH